MRHPAWHKAWHKWADERWLRFLSEIPESWAAHRLLLELWQRGRIVQVPGITVGNPEGVARVKLDTSGESRLPPHYFETFGVRVHD